MEHTRKYFGTYLLGVLFAANFFIWYAVSADGRGVLTVAFLDIGQGDAIFIESPAKTQLILDGGPDKTILSQIGALMPFYDRSIDMLVVSNPDKDHYAGFIDILKNYSVGEVMEPGTISHTATYKVFEDTVQEKKVPDILARRGMSVDLGGGAHLDILFPDRDVSDLAINDGSIVAKLVYGGTSFMLPGDSPQKIEEYLTKIDGKNLDVDVLKLGHHGSRTSSSPIFLAATTPAYAIVSAGLHNKYGHPHKEVIDLLNKLNIPTLKTFEEGTIVFQSDGERVWRK